jgi:hypothetical protein
MSSYLERELIRSEVVTAINIKITVFFDMAQCSLFFE